ncbi:MAG: hypothetical protein ACRBB0_24080 [Pelagimonas sp.]|uniref:hypothetical protein n=1 Tax=Pelagimonas sp. TaxID=2073170 RepID=UPI003D6AC5EB
MKKTLLTLTLVLSATLAQADTVATVTAILDKPMGNSKVSDAYIRSNGMVEGKFDGKAYKGTWEFKDGMYCRKIAMFKLDGCQNVVAVQNKDGKLVGVEFRNPGKKKGNRYFLK